MADTKISADYAGNPFTWSGTEVLPGIKTGANGAGLVSALQTYFATLKTAQNEAPTVSITSSASVAVGAAAANTVTITGTNTISSFDTAPAGAKRRVVFSGILTLVHNATSFILPSAANITTAANDSAEFVSLGAGNWQCVQYQRANGTAIIGSSFSGGTLASALNEAPPVTIASAASVAIGAAAANSVNITGTTTITSFDTVAAGAVRRVLFAGALTLTHNATALILPSGASITTAAGDVAWMESLGAGNWRCVGYQKASGAAVVSSGGSVDAQVFTATGTWTKPASATFVEVICIGPGGSGGGGGGFAGGTRRDGGGGGGGGSFVRRLFKASDLGATEACVIGSAGTAGAAGTTGSGTDANPGTDTTFGTTKCAAYAGGAGKGGNTNAGGVSGGGGGGSASAGNAGTTGNIVGGLPASVAAIDGFSGAGGGSTAFGPGNHSESGGGGGGGSNGAAGASIYGGSGGGGGGTISASGTSFNIGRGGRTSGWGYATGSGVAGASNGAGGGGAGAAGTAGTTTAGGGGGGGGDNTGGTGGAGAIGGTAGGGGGGGGSGTPTGGAGAVGGRGEIRVFSW